MKYSQVHIEAIGYELPPVVVSTAELESRLAPVYQALKMSPGQLELLTGINERRWWEPGYSLDEGLATRLGDGLGRKGRATVTLVDRARTHLWKPLLHEFAAGSMDLDHHALPYLAQARWHHFRFQRGSQSFMPFIRYCESV